MDRGQRLSAVTLCSLPTPNTDKVATTTLFLAFFPCPARTCGQRLSASQLPDQPAVHCSEPQAEQNGQLVFQCSSPSQLVCLYRKSFLPQILQSIPVSLNALCLQPAWTAATPSFILAIVHPTSPGSFPIRFCPTPLHTWTLYIHTSLLF